MSYSVPSPAVKAAMKAHSTLNIFAGIEALLEGGTVSGDNATAKKIIALCKKECHRQLVLMDAAIEKTNKAKP